MAVDGLPVQCVGPWARDKHDYLRRYIDATCAARAKYLPPNGPGGAAFVDLFAGPGPVCIEGEVIPGSPLIALAQEDAPFTRLIICDIDADNVAALAMRTSASKDRVKILSGDCNKLIADVMKLVPVHGLNLSLVDPFGPRGLVWETLEILGSAKRMDFIINFPTGPIKRNFPKEGFHESIDRAIGTNAWRADVQSAEDVPKLIEHLKANLTRIGYGAYADRSPAVKIPRKEYFIISCLLRRIG